MTWLPIQLDTDSITSTEWNEQAQCLLNVSGNAIHFSSNAKSLFAGSANINRGLLNTISSNLDAKIDSVSLSGSNISGGLIKTQGIIFPSDEYLYIYSSNASTKKLTMAGAENITYLYGGNTTGDDLRIFGSYKDSFPYINLVGSGSITLYKNTVTTSLSSQTISGGTIIGKLNSPYRYQIFVDGSIYKSKRGTDGSIVYQSTDFANVVNNTISSMRVNPTFGGGILKFAYGVYDLYDTINATCFNTVELIIEGEGYGATNIYGHTNGKPMIDFAGSHRCTTKNISLIGMTGYSDEPSVGILESRVSGGNNSSAPSAGEHNYDNVEISGYFKSASLFNYGSEENTYINCRIVNDAEKPAVYITNRNSGSIIIHSPRRILSSGAQSTSLFKFIGGSITGDPAIYIDGYIYDFYCDSMIVSDVSSYGIHLSGTMDRGRIFSRFEGYHKADIYNKYGGIYNFELDASGYSSYQDYAITGGTIANSKIFGTKFTSTSGICVQNLIYSEVFLADAKLKIIDTFSDSMLHMNNESNLIIDSPQYDMRNIKFFNSDGKYEINNWLKIGSGISSQKISSNIIKTSIIYGGTTSDYSPYLQLYNGGPAVFWIPDNYFKLYFNNVLGYLFYYYPGETTSIIYGSDTSGYDFKVRANFIDQYPYIKMEGSGSITLYKNTITQSLSSQAISGGALLTDIFKLSPLKRASSTPTIGEIWASGTSTVVGGFYGCTGNKWLKFQMV